ncbi:hypothetical protein ACOMHN_053977 [Nucella lapillus]
MPRRTSFAEVSRVVTKRTPSQKPEGKPEKKKRFSSKDRTKSECSVFSHLEDIAPEKDANAEATRDSELCRNLAVDSKTDQILTECVVLMEEGEEEEEEEELGAFLPENLQDDNDIVDEDGGEEGRPFSLDKRSVNEANRKFGKARKLSKKQLRLREEELEEEREKDARRKRRKERRRRKEIEARLAEEDKPQSFDEAAFKKSVYSKVQASLDLVMPQGEITLTVDNLPPLMKGFDLDTGDRKVKDLIMDALLNSYGLIDPRTVDHLLLTKSLQDSLEDLENCVDAAFEVLDQDGDGLITARDLYRLMIHLGEVLWDDQIEAMLRTADVDGDGRISKKGKEKLREEEEELGEEELGEEEEEEEEENLFLFLIGQEKSVKLEDQILKQKTHSADAENDLKPTSPDSVSSDVCDSSSEKDSGFSKTPSIQSLYTDTADGAWAKTTTSKFSMTAVESLEDLQAVEWRRKIFSGYSMASAKTPASQPDLVSLQGNTLKQQDLEKTANVPDPEKFPTIPNSVISTIPSPEEIPSLPDADVLASSKPKRPESTYTNLGDTVAQKHSDDLSATTDNSKQIKITELPSFENLETYPKHVLASVSMLESKTEIGSSAGIDNEDSKQMEDSGTTTRNIPKGDQQEEIYIHIESSEWEVESTGVKSEDYADMLSHHHDGETEVPDTPLTLERGISLLPPPEFEPLPYPPLSPHPPSSRLPSLTSSPRSRHQHFVSCAERPDSPLQAAVSTKRQDAQRAFSIDLDRLVTSSDLHPDLADNNARESQNNSNPEKEDVSLPEISQQQQQQQKKNLILKEIEEQILQTKEALETKTDRTTDPGGKVVFMIGKDDDDDDDDEDDDDGVDDDDDGHDGRQSVVESIIQPVYVPPCAREASNELRLPVVEVAPNDVYHRGHSAEDIGVWSRRPSLIRSKDSRAGVSDTGLNLLEDEDAYYSFGDVEYQPPASRNSLSTTTFSLDVSGHVSSLGDDDEDNDDEDHEDDDDDDDEDDGNGGDFMLHASPKVSDGIGLEVDHKMYHNNDENCTEILKKKDSKEMMVEVGKAEEEKETRTGTAGQTSSRVRSASDRSRKLTSRQPQSPLRHSLTCHLVTLKDLSASTPSFPTTLSPREPSRLKRGLSSPRLRTFSSCRRDPSLSRRDPPAAKRGPDDAMLQLPASFLELPSLLPWQGFPPRGAASLNRTTSPLARGDTRRFYSPSAARGDDSFRTPRIDSPPADRRNQLHSPRSPHSPSGHGSRLECAAGTGQHFSRRQKEAWGRSVSSQRESSPLARAGMSTDISPVNRSPASRSPAYRSPIDRSPASRSPAYRSPGDRSPVNTSPASRSPAHRSLAYRSLGDRSPMDRSPVNRSPASRSPAHRSPIDRSPAGRRIRTVAQEADDNQAKKDTGRFYGPNFELIMNQKGEPEDLLQQSLFPASPRSPGAQQTAADDQKWIKNNRDSSVTGGGRRILISKQLERVKEMEIRITQRHRQNVDVDDDDNNDLTLKNSGENPPGLRRCSTTSNFASGDVIEPDQSSAHTPGGGGGGGGGGLQGPRHRIRPSSCSSLRKSRRMAVSESAEVNKVVTPEDSETVRSSKSVESHTSFHQRIQKPQQVRPTVNVINMEPPLNDEDNTVENPHENSDQPEKRKHISIFKPLARMLLLYEKARQRQTALEGTKVNIAATATSISRQLQQGIPYRPPTPPRHSLSLPSTSSHRKIPERSWDRFEDCTYPRTILESSPKNSPSRNVSFVHSTHKEVTSQEPSGMTKHDLLFDEESTQDLLTERMTSIRAQRNVTSSVTFEFPERSVCVVKPKVVNTEPKSS